MDFITSILQGSLSYLNQVTGNNHFLIAAIFAGAAVLARKLPFKVWHFFKIRLLYTYTVMPTTWHNRALAEKINEALSTSESFKTRDALVSFESGGTVNLFSNSTRRFLWLGGIPCIISIDVQSQDITKLTTATSDVYLPSFTRVTLITLGCFRDKLNNHINSTFIEGIKRDSEWCAVIEEKILGFRTRYARFKPTLKKPFCCPEIYSEMEMRMARVHSTDTSYYRKHGIPAKEVFYLFGPPGTGKSSLARFMAMKSGTNILVCNAHTLDVTVTTIANRPSVDISKGTTLIIEDLEGVKPKPKGSGTAAEETPLMSKERVDEIFDVKGTLLRLLDGVDLPGGLSIFITSNHVDEIPDALTRPGRVEMFCEIAYPSTEDQLNVIGYEDHSLTEHILNNYKDDLVPGLISSLSVCETTAQIDRVFKKKQIWERHKGVNNTNYVSLKDLQ